MVRVAARLVANRRGHMVCRSAFAAYTERYAMTLDVVRRLAVVVGLCAVAGLGGPTIAQAQRNQERHEDQKDAKQQKEKDKKQQKGDEKAAKDQDKATARRRQADERGASQGRDQQARRKQDQ